MRNTIALNVNHHMTPEGAVKQSLIVTVLVSRKSRGKDQKFMATWLRGVASARSKRTHNLQINRNGVIK